MRPRRGGLISFLQKHIKAAITSKEPSGHPDIHGISVWWDYNSAAGTPFEGQIIDEISSAKVVTPLLVRAKHPIRMGVEGSRTWTRKARSGANSESDATTPFESIHASDFIGWNGAVDHPPVQEFIRQISRLLDKPGEAAPCTLEEFHLLPDIHPLPGNEEAEALLATFKRAFKYIDAIQFAEVADVQLEDPVTYLLGTQRFPDTYENLALISLR